METCAIPWREKQVICLGVNVDWRGELSDGTIVVVRVHSKSGGPTIEIQKKPYYKFRY